MEEITECYYKSPIGTIEIKGVAKGITSVQFVEKQLKNNKYIYEGNNNKVYPVINQCRDQLEEYFNGNRKEFEIDIILKGTSFQNKVWRELMKIPFGVTVSYKYIAEAIGSSKAFRAVGNANNKNPISIIIPCHRVIGANNKLVGYGGGLWRKEWLLNHENKLYHKDSI
ncbi:methylated-DNA--[protein]-cysteine S-methyltransferase [Haloimpatiens lingqiaonensis]|uniref:methylated-DNA--[protein]-cysteine S-methyltransferase n=1 Tax=Haloimpatiens lingqiaonensis TaxID=1380675 RepID=UPI001A9B552A|nr:methylated-DNA--[protein]-cysteine S-methyltransferase [Haloimpatiens lingqiaonensis]